MYTRSWMSPAWLSPYGSIVVFFCVAHYLGYVEATLSLLAVMVLFFALRCPRRVHFVTTVILTFVAGTLLWANLRPTGWQRQWNQDTPKELDFVTEKMFWRGWPVSPWMLCKTCHIILDPGGCFAQLSLVVDGAVYAIALFAAKALCERCLWRRDNDGKTCKDK